MRKTFTLIELIIVIIVISILAGFALPMYLRSIETAKEGKALWSMRLISEAEKLYRAEKDDYLSVESNFGNSQLNEYSELFEMDQDTDWNYSVVALPAPTLEFTITAERVSGRNAGEKITLDHLGSIDKTNWSP